MTIHISLRNFLVSSFRTLDGSIPIFLHTHQYTYFEVHNYVIDQFRNSHFDARQKHVLSFFAVIRNTSQPFHFATVNFKNFVEILDPGLSFG
jgi:hypothetical protein